MKTTGFTLTLALMGLMKVQGQQSKQQVVGEYYLSGVMETASGFKLNADSTFQFFYSQGALDRTGQGTWAIKGGCVILNSSSVREKDYTLIKKQSSTDNAFTIKITGDNPNVLRYNWCFILNKGKETQFQADDQGVIILTAELPEKISLLFELCPEKRSDFELSGDYNYYEFRLEPSITDVIFKDFALKIEPNSLSGSHPLLEKGNYQCKRAK